MRLQEMGHRAGYCTAQYHRIDYFVTNDLGMLKHKWEGIAVISPRKLLETVA